MDTVTKIFAILWPYLAMGGGITVITQIIKRVTRLERSGVIRLLFHTATFLATAATYWVNNTMPLYMLILHGGTYSGVASSIYPIVKWLDSKITNFYTAVKLVKKYEPELAQMVRTAEGFTDSEVNKEISPAPPVNF